MAEIAKLIERLRNATGPSLVLDGEIWCAVNGYEFVQWDGSGCVYRDPSAPKWAIGINHASSRDIRPFTASLDATVALVERMLPGWRIVAHWGENYSCARFKRGWGAKQEYTPPVERADDEICLGLLTALLSALDKGGEE